MIGEDIIVDEFGRLWLADDDGNPYSGPYDTLEDAQKAMEDSDDF